MSDPIEFELPGVGDTKVKMRVTALFPDDAGNPRSIKATSVEHLENMARGGAAPAQPGMTEKAPSIAQ